LNLPRRKQQRRAAFTLVEALVAITLAAMAGSAVMLGVTSNIQSTDYAIEETIARGMAEQVIDEVLNKHWVIPGGDPYQYPMSASAWEQGGNGRERYNDTDDYHGFVARPPEDLWGIRLGSDDGEGGLRHYNFQAASTLLADWRQEIHVYYVNESDPSQNLSGSQTSNMRAVEVTISKIEPNGSVRELAKIRRVFAYFPPL